jgi:preprotein translocase subunit YajC
MMGALAKGDIVRTNGGIRGEITALDERDVTIEVADRTRIRVLRSHIAGLDEPPTEKS